MSDRKQRRLVYIGTSAALALLLFSALVLTASRNRVYDQWLRTAPLPEPREWPRAIVSDTTLYVLGGKPLVPSASFIVSATVGGNEPRISFWNTVTLTSSPPISLYLHAVAQNGNDAYVIGGWDGKRRYATVWRCRLGGKSDCLDADQDFPMKIVLHDALAKGDYIYVFGGLNESDDVQDAIYKAKIESGGKLGRWRESQWIPTKIERTAVVEYGGYIYVLGGFDGESARREIYRSKIGPNGELMDWEDRRKDVLPRPLYYHDAVVLKERLYIFGGMDDEKKYRKVYSAGFNAEDGSLEPWEEEKKLPASLAKHAVVRYEPDTGGKRFYIIGGEHETRAQSQLYYSISNTPTPTATPTPTPTPSSTPTPIPPTPGLAFISLQNTPDQMIADGDELTYIVRFRNGPDPLSNFQITSTVPTSLTLLTNGFTVEFDGSLNLGFSGTGSGDTITWSVQPELQPEQKGRLTFRTKRDASDTGLLTHPGVEATWVVSGTFDDMPSNPTFNPAEKAYLPFRTNPEK